ncbi:hypothetical protein CDL12_11421 [Handroanthus impetiginosus]|uniref:RING-type E3 ubiquitin transferase n=1 Tax=Handroanthus impetiginosus TaxID=429701 RepID=A0A2G9HEG8_9LAMI|nr:hypothetical protein CDL12_11421 [Handroanthus impetiginosus]
MDRSSGKRSAGGLVTRTKACISGLKDATSEGDENAQFCNRIGCRGRIKYSHNMKTGSSDKAQGSSPSSHSSNKNKLIGKSSLCSSMISRARKSYLESKRKLSSRLNFDPSKRSLSRESGAPELTSSPSGYQSESMKKSGEVTVIDTWKLRISTNADISSPSSRTGDQSEPTKKSGEVAVRELRRTRTSSNAFTSSPSGRTGDQSESMKKSGEVAVREMRRTRISSDVLMSSSGSRSGDQSESTKKPGENTQRETRRPRISSNALMCSPSSQTRDKSEPMKKSGDVIVTGARQPRVSSSALMSPPSSQTGDHIESKKKSREVTVTETVRPRNRSIIFHDKSQLHHQNDPPSTSVSLASKSSTSDGASDVVPPSSSMELESAGEKRSSGRENSPFHGAIKTTTASTIDRKNSPSMRGISISNSRLSGGAASVSTRRPTNLNVGLRLSPQPNGRSSSSVGRPAIRISQSPDNVGDQSSPRHLSVRFFSSDSRLPSPSNSIGDSEHGFTRLMNHEMFHRRDLERIAEGLLAFRRFEQYEEWTDEEALALYLSNLDDQHQDMRLDIDNMSYEELLALEERMGTVSTALSEEALSKCLRRSIYQPDPSKVQITGTGEDGADFKCSICQEEYVVGDEVGKLVDCQHGYHVTCIKEWLNLKNWCPICKASSGPSQSSLSL